MRMGRRQVYEVGSVGCFVSGLGEGVSVLARDFGLAVVFFWEGLDSDRLDEGRGRGFKRDGSSRRCDELSAMGKVSCRFFPPPFLSAFLFRGILFIAWREDSRRKTAQTSPSSRPNTREQKKGVIRAPWLFGKKTSVF